MYPCDPQYNVLHTRILRHFLKEARKLLRIILLSERFSLHLALKNLGKPLSNLDLEVECAPTWVVAVTLGTQLETLSLVIV